MVLSKSGTWPREGVGASVGFTGTREGLTVPQTQALIRIFETPPYLLHHGDCVGADAEVHEIARRAGVKTIIVHPPREDALRAFCTADELRLPLPYLDRNRNIVGESSILLAAPNSTRERKRSGTWSTVRYARRLRRPVLLVFPDGKVKKEFEGRILGGRG